MGPAIRQCVNTLHRVCNPIMFVPCQVDPMGASLMHECCMSMQTKILTARLTVVPSPSPLSSIMHALGTGSSCSSQTDVAAPVLETVRFAASQEVLFDFTRNFQHHLHSVRYIGSCTPRGFSHVVPSLGGLLNPLPFLPLSDEALQQVFSRSTLLWLHQFQKATIGDPEFLAEVRGSVSQ